VLKTYGNAKGKEGTQMVSVARELVLVLSAQSKYEAEEKMRRSILEADEEVLGKEHPQTLKTPAN
jgi:hypothetical protein